MIETVTFTGVDNHTSLLDLPGIARQYPKVEFGILIGSQPGGIYRTLPEAEEFKSYCRFMGIRSALHLCGRYSRLVMDTGGATNFNAYDLLGVCAGFNRVQVNLHGDYWNQNRIDVSAENIIWFASEVEADSVILQHREPWEDTPVRHPSIEYLFDRSEGRGAEGFDAWPPPPPHVRVGYAGGLGPQNIGRALAFSEKHPDARLWFDMESNIRQAGVFSAARVSMVCARVWEGAE